MYDNQIQMHLFFFCDRSQDDAPMLTELFPDCVVQTEPGSDWVQLLSEGGTALQKLAVEQTLCLEVPDKAAETHGYTHYHKHANTILFFLPNK